MKSRGEKMKIVAQRLRGLRNKANLSQVKMADALGIKHGAVNRYENNQSEPSCETLLIYANFFDVSLDYIFGRTENPQGAEFKAKPKMELANPEMKLFIEMCFDPKSPMNDRLKETLFKLMEGMHNE